MDDLAPDDVATTPLSISIPDRRKPVRPPPPPDASAQMLSRAQELSKKAEEGSTATMKAQEAAITQRGEKTAAMGADYEAAGKDLLATPQPTPVAKPNTDLGTFLDKKNYEQFSYGLLAMGLIGAVASRGNFLGAAAALNGALKGYKEGNEAIFTEKKEEYKRNLDAALEKQKESVDAYKRIMDNKSMSLNMKSTMMSVEAAKNHQEDMRFAAQNQHWDRMEKLVSEQYKAYEKHVDNARGMDIKLLQIENAILKNQQAASTAHGQLLRDPEGKLHFLTPADVEKIDTTGWMPVSGRGGTSGTGLAGQQGSRIVASLNQLSKSVKAVVDMPVDTSTGVFGGRHQGGSLMDASLENFANQLTTESQRDYTTMMAGVQRNLATVEASGAATGLVGLTKSMDVIMAKETDTIGSKLRTLAEIRQIADSGVETVQANPNISKEQKDLTMRALNDIKQAIPFTHADLSKLQKQKNPKATFKDIGIEKSKEAGAATIGPFDDAEKERRYQEWKKTHAGQ